ncbi:predicted protein [Histoplasma mississippiense (nom. inval.)]|uniref:predicted protein n=1 Tax=Ajellomyces capsulatus (strain NAm1 / WU24) TaxID=2059318 RepID=UPI000157B3AE|nr:predicted protein [Histoplasma mississippiense (nom. inval.)]EDN02736.1 predicted protein [Histoplasma mississippiense (nom. inval.)]
MDGNSSAFLLLSTSRDSMKEAVLRFRNAFVVLRFQDGEPTCLSTQKMKSPFSQVLSLAALALTWSPTQAAQLATRDITMFEERFLNSLEYQLPNNTIKLIGFKKVKVPEHELGDLNQHYMSNPKEWGKLNNYFYDPPSGRTLSMGTHTFTTLGSRLYLITTIAGASRNEAGRNPA